MTACVLVKYTKYTAGRKVNEETSLWLCFFYDRSEALDSLRRDEDLHIDNCIVKQIICIREIFRVRCTKHNTKKEKSSIEYVL